MKSWKELKEFKNIDLHDSFVIGWKSYNDTFFIDMEVSIWPGHKAYVKPEKGEYTCYKKGRLTFRNPTNIKGLLTMSEVKPNEVLPTDIPDYDTIEDFEIKGSEIHLIGAFGDVTLLAKNWGFKIATRFS